MSVLGWANPHSGRKELLAWPADDLYSSVLSPGVGLWSQEPGPKWAGSMKEYQVVDHCFSPQSQQAVQNPATYKASLGNYCQNPKSQQTGI